MERLLALLEEEKDIERQIKQGEENLAEMERQHEKILKLKKLLKKKYKKKKEKIDRRIYRELKEIEELIRQHKKKK